MHNKIKLPHFSYETDNEQDVNDYNFCQFLSRNINEKCNGLKTGKLEILIRAPEMSRVTFINFETAKTLLIHCFADLV